MTRKQTAPDETKSWEDLIQKFHFVKCLTKERKESWNRSWRSPEARRGNGDVDGGREEHRGKEGGTKRRSLEDIWDMVTGARKKSEIFEAEARQTQFAARETRDNFEKSLAKMMAKDDSMQNETWVIADKLWQNSQSNRTNGLNLANDLEAVTTFVEYNGWNMSRENSVKMLGMKKRSGWEDRRRTDGLSWRDSRLKSTRDCKVQFGRRFWIRDGGCLQRKLFRRKIAERWRSARRVRSEQSDQRHVGQIVWRCWSHWHWHSGSGDIPGSIPTHLISSLLQVKKKGKKLEKKRKNIKTSKVGRRFKSFGIETSGCFKVNIVFFFLSQFPSSYFLSPSLFYPSLFSPSLFPFSRLFPWSFFVRHFSFLSSLHFFSPVPFPTPFSFSLLLSFIPFLPCALPFYLCFFSYVPLFFYLCFFFVCFPFSVSPFVTSNVAEVKTKKNNSHKTCLRDRFVQQGWRFLLRLGESLLVVVELDPSCPGLGKNKTEQ